MTGPPPQIDPAERLRALLAAQRVERGNAPTASRSALGRLRDLAGNAAQGFAAFVRDFVNLSGLPPGGPNTPPEDLGFRDQADVAESVEALGATTALTAGLTLAPVLAGVLVASGTGLRAASGEPLGSAVVSTLESGLALAEPTADVADKVGADGLAALIRRHPIISEFVLQFGHDLSALAAARISRSATASALDRLAIDFQLDDAVVAAVRDMQQPPPGFVAAVEREIINRPVTQTAFVRQLEALFDQKLRVQRTLEGATNRETAQVIGRGGDFAPVPEPGLIDLESAARLEPHPVNLTGRQAYGLDADVALSREASRVPQGEQPVLLDQLAVNMAREVEALDNVAAAGVRVRQPLNRSRPDFENVLVGGTPEQLAARETARVAEGTAQMQAAQVARLATRALTASGPTLLNEVGGASAKLLSQLVFLGGGGALSQSENEYIRYTGLGAMIIGGGSLTGPLLARAGKAGLRTTLAGVERGFGADAALATARWFVPEHGWGPEFLAIRQQIKENSARGSALAQDYARAARQLAVEAGKIVRAEARTAGFTRRESRVLGREQVGTTLRALSDVAEAEGPGAAVLAGQAEALIPAPLQERAIALMDRMLGDFYEVGQREVAVGRFAQATLDKRAGHYLPRYYLDMERRLFLGDEAAPLPVTRKVTGMRTTAVGVRDDGIPYRVRVEELNEIREADYRALRGFSRAWHNVAVEEGFQQLRALGKVWNVYDEAALSVRNLRRAETALELNDAPAADLKAIRQRLRTAQTALRQLDARPPAGFRKLPDSEGLGSLRGRWVSEETHQFLRDFDKVSSPQRAVVSWNGLMQAWKFTMTALNLPTHVGNIGSNVVLAFMNGGLPWWRVDVYKAAMADFRARGPMYRELRDLGIIGRTFINQETRNALGEFSDIVTRDARRFLRRDYDARSGILNGPTAKRALAQTERFIRAFGHVYQAEEEIFKVAVHMHNRRLGRTAREAAQIANEALVDYSARSGFINMMNSTLIPFFTFPAKVAPVLARSIINHPERLPIALAPFVGLDLISRHLVGIPEIQPYNDKKLGAFDIRYTQIPIVTEDGDMVFMNTGRFTPWGPFVTGSPVETILPRWWPQALQPSNPVIAAASLFLARDPLTGDPIMHELQSPGEKLRAVSGEAATIVAPSMFSRNLPRAIQALDREALDEFFLELGGVVGMRPTLVPQTGERERRRAFGRALEAVELGRRDLRRDLRMSGDTARVIERARRMNQRLLEMILRETESLPDSRRQRK